MDWFLVLIGIVFLVVGLIGCIVPVIPGPPLSFIGLVFLHYTDYHTYPSDDLFKYGVIAAIVTAVDYVAPLWGAKKFGGTKKGVWGATIGLVIGVFFLPPIGILIGPLAGAFIGEMMAHNDSSRSLKAAFGTFIGFLLGTGVKLVTSVYFTYLFFKDLF